MSDESILGLDNIRLELPVAGVGSRVLAGVLDYLVVGLLVLVWSLLCTFVLPALGNWGISLLIVGVFLIEWGYFAASEIATGGQTLGKKALHLQVVTAEGGAP